MKKIIPLLYLILLCYNVNVLFGQNFSSSTEDLLSEVKRDNTQLFIVTKEIAVDIPNSFNQLIKGYQSANRMVIKFDKVPQSQEIQWISSWSKLESKDKYSDQILEWSIQQGGWYQIFIEVDKTIPEEDIQSKTQSIGLDLAPTQKWKSHNLWQVYVKDLEHLILIAEKNWVIHLSPVTEDINLNDGATAITGADIAQSGLPGIGFGLSGKGITVGVGDDGMNNHADVNARIIQNFNPVRGSGHAVHVATTGFGAGIKDERYTGFATEADIVSQFFSAVIAYGTTLHEDYNMTITNNSYAAKIGDCDYAGTYTSVSRILDEMAINHPKLLHVFAAGNDGEHTCPPYSVGFGTTVGSYQPSKNTLTVANMGKSIYLYHPSSSRGPVKDGRIKPEIAAIGRAVKSGWLNDIYTPYSGTSMACPNVSGAAALLSEQFQLMYTDSLPDNALLKILLMNGATDIYNFGPDYRYGFGMMDLQRSILMLKNNQIIKSNVAHGVENTHTITIPSGVSRAKIMVYWNDVPALPTSDLYASKLINDLDMTLATPSSEIFTPWILDPTNPDNPAVRGVDHINNVEQITIENPTAGSYSIKIKGHNVVAGTQPYYLAWDLEPDTISLLSPIGGEKYAIGDSIKIFWKSPITTSTFSCQISLDNGMSWLSLSSSIPSSGRDFTFFATSDHNSPNCKIRILENATGQTVTSNLFSIGNMISVHLAEESAQCPGSISINWDPLPLVDQYALFKEMDGKMIAVDTVSSATTTYTFSGLIHTERQWVTVAPIYGIITGIRGIAISRIPNSGSCINTDLPESDLAIIKISNPNDGRIFTSTALNNDEIVSVQVENRGKNPISSITLSYSLDESTTATKTFEVSIPPGGNTAISFEEFPLDLSSIGTHELVVYHHAASIEQFRWNDTLKLTFRQIDNPQIDIEVGYVENFEAMNPITIEENKIGLSGIDRWDYTKTNGYGRLKSFVNSDVAINGIRAISMDLDMYSTTLYDSASTNSLIGTMNLSEVDINSVEIRMDFWYRFSGRPKFQDENRVSIRGSDTDPWITVLSLDTTFASTLRHSGIISLNDFLISHAQNFSSSSQIKIDQRDTSLICGIDFGNGLTVDSFRLFAVTNDVSIEGISKPVVQGCEFGSEEQVSILVRNNVFYPLENVSVSYRLNGGAVHTEIIPNIPAKTTLEHTFTNTEDLSESGSYRLSAWAEYPEDNFSYNDSILNYEIYHAKSIAEFPYIEDFETNDGAFRTIDSSSFIWSTPDNGVINEAANGKFAWSASSIKLDNTRSLSYLYSPCFEIAELEFPYLSFSFSGNFPFEDSTAPSSYAYIEYSEDGNSWFKLGSENTGYNWYNHDSNVWALSEFPWMVATHPIPEGVDKIIFRWAFVSFPGSRTANIGIDDIHIYSSDKSIYEDRGQFIATKNILEPTLIDDENFEYGRFSPDQPLGDSKYNVYNINTPIVTEANEAILPTSFVFDYSSKATTDIELYVPHESIKILNDANCGDCFRPKSIYDLGISNFHSENKTIYNDLLEDNKSGIYSVINNDKIYFLPYRNGYIAQFTTDLNGEFWFNYSAHEDQSIDFMPVTLSGQQNNNVMALLNWESKIDPSLIHFYLERLDADGNFIAIHNRNPDPTLNGQYSYVDHPELIDNTATYRLRYDDQKGIIRYTKTITMLWNDFGTFSIYPNPIYEDLLNVTWDLSEPRKIIYRIIDMSGKIITTKEWIPTTNKGVLNISMKEIGITPGNYIIELFNGRESMTHKFVYVR